MKGELVVLWVDEFYDDFVDFDGHVQFADLLFEEGVEEEWLDAVLLYFEHDVRKAVYLFADIYVYDLSESIYGNARIISKQMNE